MFWKHTIFQTHISHRTELDGLRCIAVLAVIFYHSGVGSFGGGFVGVDVFFVISGYLMTSLIMAKISSGHLTLAKFYERKARRISPMLFFTITVCLLPAHMYMDRERLVILDQKRVLLLGRHVKFSIDLQHAWLLWHRHRFDFARLHVDSGSWRAALCDQTSCCLDSVFAKVGRMKNVCIRLHSSHLRHREGISD